MAPPAVKTWSTLGCGRPLDVEDHQAIRAGRDIGVGPRQVDVASVGSGSVETGWGWARSVISRTLIPSASQA